MVRNPHVPVPEHTHRKLGGGQARAAVFGVSDGLVSNVSLVLGVAGSGVGASVVRMTGLAGLVAGAVSMAAGEWVSMQAQRELLERELDRERHELVRNPEGERRELAAIYETRGVGPERARELAADMIREPDMALETHAREELGIDPRNLGSPVGAALWSLVCFTFGALLPLLPWWVTSGTAAQVGSLVIGVIAASLVGVALARQTGRSPVRTAIRQAAFLVVACGATTLVGALVGVNVT